MSKPIAAARSSCATESLNVPCRSGRPSSSTCGAATSAGRTRTRSRTRPACGPPRPAPGSRGGDQFADRVGGQHRPELGGQRRTDALGDRAGRRPAAPRSPPRSRRRSAAPVARRSASSSRAPVSRSLAISSPLCPAAALASTACRQVPSGSLQASTWKRPQALPVRHHDGLVPGAPGRPPLHQDQRGAAWPRSRPCGCRVPSRGAGGRHDHVRRRPRRGPRGRPSPRR